MSKSSDAWLSSAKYGVFGIKPPAEMETSLEDNLAYVRRFLVPAAFMISGMSKDEFDFKKANSGTNESLQYLSSLIGGSDTNKLISILNAVSNSPAWMLYLPSLVDLYKYDGNLSSSIRSAVAEYFKTHRKAYGVCYNNGTDVEVILDSSGKPLPEYPSTTILYPEEYLALHTIRHGTNTLSNLLHKEWWRYTKQDKNLLNQIPWLVASDFSVFEIPILRDDASVVYEDRTYLTPGNPPDEVLDLYTKLPESLLKEYGGNKVYTLVAYCSDNPDTLKSEAGIEFVHNLSAVIEKAHPHPVQSAASLSGVCVTLPEASKMEDFAKQIEEAGYVTKSLSDAIKDYLSDFELDPGITVQQLIDFINADEDGEPPVPFNKDKFAAEVYNKIDWDGIEKETIDSIDKVEIVQEKLGSIGVPDDMLAEITAALREGRVADVMPKEEPIENIVTEALTEIGMDDDMLSRIKLAMSTGSKLEFEPNSYYDKYDKAGSQMLHEMRKHLCHDDGWQIRADLQQVMYAYFHLLMAADSKRHEVIEYLVEERDKSPDKAKVIINGALEVLNNG